MSDLYEYMYAAGDPAGWEALTEESCVFCVSVLDDVRSMVASGQRESGTDVDVQDSTGTEIIPGESYTATLIAVQAPTERLSASGEVVSTGTGGRYELLLALAWTGEWSVRAVDVRELEPS